MLDAFLIMRMQDEATVRLHEPGNSLEDGAWGEGLMTIAATQHRANFELWHEEDKARVPGVPDSEIARVKRAIDVLNQRRNDLMEKVDVWLMEGQTQNVEAPLHSETPGLMIDRLSILALKIYHTREEAGRMSATEAHRLKNAERLALLEQQRSDLVGCLDVLWGEVTAGTRRFKLYRQMKMYNDPELNPAVYGRM
jgi:Protein of unknown function (DUF4254)